jgi:RNA polymerase sigma factor (sigma-70 family)
MVAYRFLRRQEEAEDAVQEVFVKLWNRKDKLDEYDSIEALAITTIKNYCIDQLRKKRTLSIDGDLNYISITLNEPTPYERLENIETSGILNNIIGNLPGLYKDVVIMREIDGLSYEEISQITGQNVNTLRVNLSRARNMIKDELTKAKYEYTGEKKTAGKIL